MKTISRQVEFEYSEGKGLDVVGTVYFVGDVMYDAEYGIDLNYEVEDEDIKIEIFPADSNGTSFDGTLEELRSCSDDVLRRLVPHIRKAANDEIEYLLEEGEFDDEIDDYSLEDEELY